MPAEPGRTSSRLQNNGYYNTPNRYTNQMASGTARTRSGSRQRKKSSEDSSPKNLIHSKLKTTDSEADPNHKLAKSIQFPSIVNEDEEIEIAKPNSIFPNVPLNSTATHNLDSSIRKLVPAPNVESKKTRKKSPARSRNKEKKQSKYHSTPFSAKNSVFSLGEELSKPKESDHRVRSKSPADPRDRVGDDIFCYL